MRLCIHWVVQNTNNILSKSMPVVFTLSAFFFFYFLFNKGAKEIKGKGLGTQSQKRPHHTHLAGSKESSDELGYPHTESGRQAGGADAFFGRESYGKKGEGKKVHG